MDECTICRCEFDLELEGGREGWIGIIPVWFCPVCTAGIYDFVEVENELRQHQPRRNLAE